MQEKSVLLESGRSHDVTLLRGAHAFLAETLGTDSKRVMLMTLRSMQDRKGVQRVAVFVGNKRVGYLSTDFDEGLLATIKTCSAKRAVARARGTLLAPTKASGKVRVTVSLAKAEHSLPVSQERIDSTEQAKAPTPPSAETPVTASLDEALVDHILESIDQAPSADEEEPVDQAPSADDEEPITQDVSVELVQEEPASPKLPDEVPVRDSRPPVDQEPSADGEEPADQAPSASEERSVTRDSSGELDSVKTPASSTDYVGDFPDWPPPKPKPAVLQRLSVADQPPKPVNIPPTTRPKSEDDPSRPPQAPRSEPSAAALLSTRSAWTADMARQKYEPQPGWLTYSGGSTEHSSPPGTDATDRATRASRGNGFDSEIASTWNSSTSSSTQYSQQAPQKRAAKRSHNISGCLVPLVVILLLMGAIAFLVWKFVFGPTTFTDPDYGYSFSHPGRWQVVAADTLPPQFAYLTTVRPMPDVVIVGKSLDSDDPSEAALVAVARGEGFSTSGSVIAAEVQGGLYRVADPSIGVSLIEPTYSTSVGGLDAWRMTVSIGVRSYPMTVTYCVVVDGKTAYILIAAATESAWDDNRATFDRFVESFKPAKEADEANSP